MSQATLVKRVCAAVAGRGGLEAARMNSPTGWRSVGEARLRGKEGSRKLAGAARDAGQPASMAEPAGGGGRMRCRQSDAPTQSTEQSKSAGPARATHHVAQYWVVLLHAVRCGHGVALLPVGRDAHAACRGCAAGQRAGWRQAGTPNAAGRAGYRQTGPHPQAAASPSPCTPRPPAGSAHPKCRRWRPTRRCAASAWRWPGRRSHRGCRACHL